MNTCESAHQRTRVPVRVRGQVPAMSSPLLRVKSPTGPTPSNTPGTPRLKDMVWVFAPRSTSISRRAESALTTEAPTPCSPPEAVYEPPPNLPPACNLVITTSTPVSLVLGSISTGIPRPSSLTSAEPSGCKVTMIFLHDPASASSIALSTISQRQCINPRPSFDPMYIPGRLRTASKPSKTARFLAVYAPPATTSTPPAALEAADLADFRGILVAIRPRLRRRRPDQSPGRSCRPQIITMRSLCVNQRPAACRECNWGERLLPMVSSTTMAEEVPGT